jgi:hypothetical protein
VAIELAGENALMSDLDIEPEADSMLNADGAPEQDPEEAPPNPAAPDEGSDLENEEAA